MDVFEVPFALLAFLAFVWVVPVWVWFTGSHSGWSALSMESQFLAGLMLPATASLAIASWLSE
jgi:hypothetical protein